MKFDDNQSQVILQAIAKQDKRYALAWISAFLMVLYAYTTNLHITLYGSDFVATLTLLMAAVLLLFLPHSVHSGRIDWIDALVLVLIFFLFVNNQDIAQGHQAVTALTTAAVWIYFLIARRRVGWFHCLVSCLAIAGIFSATMTWLTFLSPSFYFSSILPLFPDSYYDLYYQYNQGYMPGLAPHYSTNAMYLCIGLFALVYYYLRRRRGSAPAVALFIFVASALLLTGKRGPLLFLLLALLCCYYFWMDRKEGRLFKIIAIVIALVVLGVLLYSFVPFLAGAVSRFIETSMEGDISMGRSERVSAAWVLFLQHPLSGIGWNGTIYYFQSTTGEMINVHNVYVQLLCELGVIGSVWYFLFFGLSLRDSLRELVALRRIEDTSLSNPALSAVAFLIIIFVLIYCLTGNPLYDFQTLIPYLAACAFVSSAKPLDVRRRLSLNASVISPQRIRR